MQYWNWVHVFPFSYRGTLYYYACILDFFSICLRLYPVRKWWYLCDMMSYTFTILICIYLHKDKICFVNDVYCNKFDKNKFMRRRLKSLCFWINIYIFILQFDTPNLYYILYLYILFCTSAYLCAYQAHFSWITKLYKKSPPSLSVATSSMFI